MGCEVGPPSDIFSLGVSQRVCIRIRACLPFADRVRVPDADHIGTGLAEHTRVFSTCNIGTARIHAGHACEHSLAEVLAEQADRMEIARRSVTR